ncbi:hypothetical protein EZS27_006051 [termite gut metagenome]|uniref:Uncharacterized protein n=1 Tax=termite gut metagenome TaxID=433724 RepID=A0A5J4SLW9_9ZZZZ
MAKFIELHNFSGDSIFINVNKITHFSPHTSEEEGIPCTLVSVAHNFETGIIIKETPAEILDKIKESEQGTVLEAMSVEQVRESIEKHMKST